MPVEYNAGITEPPGGTSEGAALELCFFIGPLYQKISRQFNPTFYHKQKKKKNHLLSQKVVIFYFYFWLSYNKHINTILVSSVQQWFCIFMLYEMITIQSC